MLTDSQAERLRTITISALRDAEFGAALSGEQEIAYTGRVVRPMIESLVKSFTEPQLLVKGDGGVPSSALLIDAFEFYPDVEIVEFQTKHLAVEVKFLRGMHDTGALSKAIGQGLIYRELGFPSVCVLLFDTRPLNFGHLPSRPSWNASRDVGIHVFWYRQRGDVFARFDD